MPGARVYHHWSWMPSSRTNYRRKKKVSQGFAKMYLWEELKKHLPVALKLSPLVMIPYKSKKYRAILDLSLALMINGYSLPSVNEATEKLVPEEAMY